MSVLDFSYRPYYFGTSRAGRYERGPLLLPEVWTITWCGFVDLTSRCVLLLWSPCGTSLGRIPERGVLCQRHLRPQKRRNPSNQHTWIIRDSCGEMRAPRAVRSGVPSHKYYTLPCRCISGLRSERCCMMNNFHVP